MSAYGGLLPSPFQVCLSFEGRGGEFGANLYSSTLRGDFTDVCADYASPVPGVSPCADVMWQPLGSLLCQSTYLCGQHVVTMKAAEQCHCWAR